MLFRSVGYTEPGSPADRAGLEVGDRVISVSGQPTPGWYDFKAVVEARPGERVELTIDRNGDELVRAFTLDAVEGVGLDGTVRTVGRAGISAPAIGMVYAEVSMSEAVVAGYRETVLMTGYILGFLRDLVTGGISPRSVGSIVTIGDLSGQAAQAGLDSFLHFMAFFSVNLAVLNLLPIPILDGGHLVFLAIEAIRGGRALSVEQRLKWSNVGFFIIVGIMLWAL